MATTLQEYQKRLKAIAYRPRSDAHSKITRELAKLTGGLPAIPPALGDMPQDNLGKLLVLREGAFKQNMGRFFDQHMKALTEANLSCAHSYEILFAHSFLLDALHVAAFNAAVADTPVSVRLRVIEAEKELDARRKHLAKKLAGRERAGQNPAGWKQAHAIEGGEDDAELPVQERAYYEQLEAALEEEIREAEAAIAKLEACLPTWKGFRAKPKALEKRIVLFARGGYGRAEVSFSSDMDTGYCVDTRNSRAGEVEIFQDLVVRTEGLLKACGLKPAQQYFETDEDLTRFSEPETIHTIPSVLEARPILGNTKLLELLKAKFSSILPYEDFIKVKVAEFEQQHQPSLTEMDVKEDRGGLRSIQIPLWILGVTHSAKSFMSADLIEFARAGGMLSLWEATRILLGLELLNEIRNFVGLAESSYYDQEAQAGNFDIQDFPPNRINDALARLYVFRKRRFASLDELDSIRLRLAADVARISNALLYRVLDRTVTHKLGDFQVAVHLGRKRIIRIAGANSKSKKELPGIFPSGSRLLSLFEFIAITDYDLSGSLKDSLAEVLRGISSNAAGSEKRQRAVHFTGIMSAPHAHRALAAMFEISDPMSDRIDPLLGKYIPEFGKVSFLVRNAKLLNMPVHEHIVASVQNGQKSLDWLNEKYHELYALLSPSHMLALRWSLLLHGLGKIHGGGAKTAQTAELAVDVLDRLGCNSEELEAFVRLLVQHHHTIAGLSRTAAYFDQALVEYFEVAGRQMVNVVLIFLINRAILMAGGQGRGEVENLNSFFEETSRILAAARGVPEQSRSLEIINNYLYEKKVDLQAETRAHQLLNKSIAVGLDQAIFAPVKKYHPERSGKLEQSAERIGALHKALVLGQQDEDEQLRTGTRLVRELRNAIGEEVITDLTTDGMRIFTWFFCAFPNRYLLSSMPHRLAGQIAKFADFEQASTLVDVVVGGAQESTGLLIYTRGLDKSHSRVAYMLSRKRINIISGKVNRVELGDDRHGYCYYFQTSGMPDNTQSHPKDLEAMVLGETPPDPEVAPSTSTHPVRGSRLDFLGDDGKGYQIKPANGEFIREQSPFRMLRIVLRDEPFLFYKVARAFDQYGVEVRQSLITTTGNQVMDHFYLAADDYERLRASSFQERFADIMRASLV